MKHLKVSDLVSYPHGLFHCSLLITQHGKLQVLEKCMSLPIHKQFAVFPVKSGSFFVTF